MNKTLHVVRHEGKHWEERDIPVVIIDSMRNLHGGERGLCHYTGCHIILTCGEMQQNTHRVTIVLSPTVAF